MKKLRGIATLIFAFAIALTACTQNEIEPGNLELQQRVFDDLWTTVNEQYVSETFNGLDWEIVRMEYQAEIDAGISDEGFWEKMQEMVALLNDQHSRFLSPSETADEDRLLNNELSYVGIGVFYRALPDKQYGVVLFPFPGGPAEQAGIAPHDRLLLVDGEDFCCTEFGEGRVDLVLGPEGSEVVMTVQTPGESARDVTVQRAPIQVDFPVTGTTLPGDIAYLQIPTFSMPGIAQKAEDAWSAMAADGSIRGLILDLRICRGGLSDELRALLSLFSDGFLGAFASREGQRPLNIRGRDLAGSQTVPLVILIGGITESFAEVIAGSLQENGRALLVGATTAGNIEAVTRFDFEDGSSAWVARETFLSTRGASWEHVGLSPDVFIPVGWDDFSSTDEDLVLLEALRLLQGE